MKTSHDINVLPKWAQGHIKSLEERVRRAEATIPWTEPGMDWFTIHGCNIHGEPWKLYTLSNQGARAVCALGPGDRLFVGRRPVNQEETGNDEF